MKFATERPFADADIAASKLVEIANGTERSMTAASISSWSTARSSRLAANQYRAALERAISSVYWRDSSAAPRPLHQREINQQAAA
jgi:hypothetical protein